MHGLEDLREHGGMTWIDDERGWGAAPEDILDALSKDGFEERRPQVAPRLWTLLPGGVWQGVNVRTGSVASATWVERPPGLRPLVFITIDGAAVDDRRLIAREPNPAAEEGGEG